MKHLISIGQAAALLAQEFPDVSVSSLRFLERQGLIMPQRKPGGHRLFSPEDIERTRRIKQWQAQRVSLRDIAVRLNHGDQAGQASSIVGRMRALLVEDYDVAAAIAVLMESFEAGMPLLTVCNDILTPLLRSLGDKRGNHLIPVDVQMELDQQLVTFLSRVGSRPVRSSATPVIVAACPAWERHDMPLRMLVTLLSERGAAVHYIGAQVENGFVADAICRVQPDTVLISMTVPPPPIAASWFREIIAVLTPHQRMLIGGEAAALLPAFDDDNVEVLGTVSYADTVARLMADARPPS